MTKDYEYYIEENDIEVLLECSIISENSGIGSYEYWGSQEYDAGEDYLIVEEMTWDKTLYTEEENNIIQEEINKNWDKISEKVLEKFDPSDYI